MSTEEKKKELLDELSRIRELLKDHTKFLHLFSDDEGKRTLAELSQATNTIQVLFELSQLKEITFPKNKALEANGARGLVMIRPVDKQYNNKTFLGFHIGDIALSSSVGISDNKIQCNFGQFNPAIYVPELNKVIYGIESWWGEIESEEDFKKITDQDIENVWYVKLWNQINKQKETEQ